MNVGPGSCTSQALREGSDLSTIRRKSLQCNGCNYQSTPGRLRVPGGLQGLREREVNLM